jgi:hypothetical protein
MTTKDAQELKRWLRRLDPEDPAQVEYFFSEVAGTLNLTVNELVEWLIYPALAQIIRSCEHDARLPRPSRQELHDRLLHLVEWEVIRDVVINTSGISAD